MRGLVVQMCLTVGCCSQSKGMVLRFEVRYYGCFYGYISTNIRVGQAAIVSTNPHQRLRELNKYSEKPERSLRLILYIGGSWGVHSTSHWAAMVVNSKPTIPHYQPAPPTGKELDYADLVILDFLKLSTVEGRAELSALARDAMHKDGFLYVINHELSPADVARIFDIADVPFSQVPESEKLDYTGDIVKTGTDQGYKPRGHWNYGDKGKDQVENYAIKRNVYQREHPEALRPLLPELDRFARYNHSIVHIMLRLLAVGLEVPEETFVRQHGFDADGETYLRFMKYYPRAENGQESSALWLNGHTDFGTISVLWSQPVAGLQALTPDGQWKWLRHIDNALIINAGDCMEFISGGYYKAPVHRVIQPPEDQRCHTRLGVFYFSLPDSDVLLEAVRGSPVLEKAGITRKFIDNKPVTAGAWVRGRTSAYGKNQHNTKVTEDGMQEEIVAGAVVRHAS